jgi:predicted nucleotidyltransferase
VRTLDEIELRERDRTAIVTAAKMLRDRFPVVGVLLFGSKATGRDDEESDIDLLVTTSRPLGWQERDSMVDALFDMEMECDVVISTLVVSEQEWLKGPYQVLAIREQVERHGVAAQLRTTPETGSLSTGSGNRQRPWSRRSQSTARRDTPSR